MIGDGEIAVEVKGSPTVKSQDLKGLRVFMDEHKPKRSILVCQEQVSRKTADGIEILPWRKFLDQMWVGDFTPSADA